jgi:hypothetical protein
MAARRRAAATGEQLARISGPFVSCNRACCNVLHRRDFRPHESSDIFILHQRFNGLDTRRGAIPRVGQAFRHIGKTSYCLGPVPQSIARASAIRASSNFWIEAVIELLLQPAALGRRFVSGMKEIRSESSP